MCMFDPLALALFYERHVKQVFSLAVVMLEDRSHAADLTQEVFLLVWRYANDGAPRNPWDAEAHRAPDVPRIVTSSSVMLTFSPSDA